MQWKEKNGLTRSRGLHSDNARIQTVIVEITVSVHGTIVKYDEDSNVKVIVVRTRKGILRIGLVMSIDQFSKLLTTTDYFTTDPGYYSETFFLRKIY
jgi:hypothetical protein